MGCRASGLGMKGDCPPERVCSWCRQERDNRFTSPWTSTRQHTGLRQQAVCQQHLDWGSWGSQTSSSQRFRAKLWSSRRSIHKTSDRHELPEIAPVFFNQSDVSSSLVEFRILKITYENKQLRGHGRRSASEAVCQHPDGGSWGSPTSSFQCFRAELWSSRRCFHKTSDRHELPEIAPLL